jgi:hypothetical protein
MGGPLQKKSKKKFLEDTHFIFFSESHILWNTLDWNLLTYVNKC